MSLQDQAAKICHLLSDYRVENVKAFDPATLMMLVGILQQIYALAKWWKPEWFINRQTRNIIKSGLRGTDFEGQEDLVKRAIDESGALDFDIF